MSAPDRSRELDLLAALSHHTNLSWGEKVSEAQIPASNGYLGVLPDHSTLLAEMGTGELTYGLDERRFSLSVDGGWAEVLPEHVRVLATHTGVDGPDGGQEVMDLTEVGPAAATVSK